MFYLLFLFLVPQCIIAQTNDTLRYKAFLFVSRPVPEAVKTRMQGKSMPPTATVSYDELRYLTVFHYDYEGAIRKGELVCNKAIAKDLLFIFRARTGQPQKYKQKRCCDRLI